MTKLQRVLCFLLIIFTLNAISLSYAPYVTASNGDIYGMTCKHDSSLLYGNTFELVDGQPTYKNGFLNYSLILNSDSGNNNLYFDSYFAKVSNCDFINFPPLYATVPIPQGKTPISIRFDSDTHFGIYNDTTNKLLCPTCSANFITTELPPYKFKIALHSNDPDSSQIQTRAFDIRETHGPIVTLSPSPDSGFADDTVDSNVEPNTGTTDTTFTWKMVYTNIYNHAPISITLITAGYVELPCEPYGPGVGIPQTRSASNLTSTTTTKVLGCPMQVDSSSQPYLHDGNYTNGEQYIFTQKFPSAKVYYHIETDGVRYPANDEGLVNVASTNQIPDTYYSKITNITDGVAKLYEAPSVNSTLIKTLPNDWIVKVVGKLDSNNQPMISDGYRWYKVEDPTDNTLHYMISGTADEPIYLPYEKDKQAEYENNSVDNLSGDIQDKIDARKNAVLDIVDHYYNNIDSSKSLYSGNDTTKILLLKNAGFAKEIILGIIAQEIGARGDNFNNENVSYDYGHGIMQITMDAYAHENPDNKHHYTFLNNGDDPRGKYSFVTLSKCKEEHSDQYKSCYQNTSTYNTKSKPYDGYNHDSLNPKYKQYANTIQSIYSNIKDGLGILIEKYNSAVKTSCKMGDYVAENTTFKCDDLRKVKTIWGYNGISFNPNQNYMKDISNQLKVLNKTFPGITYDNSDGLIEKLAIANRHRKEIKAHSPVEIRIKDSHNNTLGIVNGQEVSDLPNGTYDSNSERAVIFFPDDNYTYQVVGDSTGGTYGLDIETYNGSDIPISFNATDIPIIPWEIHTYSVDENKLAQNKSDAVTITIDINGDGIPERTIKSDSTLTSLIPYDFYFKKPTIDGGQYKINKVLPIRIKVTKDKSNKKIDIPQPKLTLTRVSDGYVLPLKNNDTDQDDDNNQDDVNYCHKYKRSHYKNYTFKIPKNTLNEGQWKAEVTLGDIKHSIIINMVK